MYGKCWYFFPRLSWDVDRVWGAWFETDFLNCTLTTWTSIKDSSGKQSIMSRDKSFYSRQARLATNGANRRKRRQTSNNLVGSQIIADPPWYSHPLRQYIKCMRTTNFLIICLNYKRFKESNKFVDNFNTYFIFLFGIFIFIFSKCSIK